MRAQPPGFNADPTFSLANSPVSPVDRLRLLTAPSNAGGQELAISNSPLQITPPQVFVETSKPGVVRQLGLGVVDAVHYFAQLLARPAAVSVHGQIQQLEHGFRAPLWILRFFQPVYHKRVLVRTGQEGRNDFDGGFEGRAKCSPASMRNVGTSTMRVRSPSGVK